jgi:hypothetical protein
MVAAMAASAPQTAAAGPRSPIVLKGVSGGVLRIDRVGAAAVPDAVPLALDIQALDKKAAKATKLSLEQQAAVEDLRAAATASLEEGVVLATQTSSTGFPKAKADETSRMLRAAEGVLAKPWSGANVATNITDAKGRPLLYLPYVNLRRAPMGPHVWLPYTAGAVLQIRAYLFKVAADERCQGIVPVWADPTAYHLPC